MVKVIISMSGFGDRFKKAGYNEPKPLIEVDGKPMIQHVVSMFPGVTSFVFICNKEHIETTNMKQILNETVQGCQIVVIEPHKLGPVYAVSKAYDFINDNEEIIVSYCDFGSYWGFFNFMVDTNQKMLDGCVVSYRGFHPHMLGTDNYAFIKTTSSTSMMIESIQEKKPFTNNKMEEWASNGVYYFRTGQILKTYFTKLIEIGNTVNNEYYVSMVYNLMVQDGLKVGVYPIQHMLQWGTPYDLEVYNQWSHYFSNIIKQKEQIRNPEKTITILPMAGKGSRFSMKGYTRPKPLLDINGYPMFYQAVDCLPKSDNFRFITLKEHCNIYPEVEETIYQHFNKETTTILKLDEVTQGQACTCFESIKDLDDDTPILITACDNASYWDETKYKVLLEDITNDVIVWSFKNNPTSKNNPNMYSWLDVDEKDYVKQAYVKKCIFDDPYERNAIIGTFFFRKAKYFKNAYISMINKNSRTGNEFYVDTMLNECIEQNLKVKNFNVIHYICWGIPDEYETYNYWRSYFHKTIYHPYRIYKDITFNKKSNETIKQIEDCNKIQIVKQQEECCLCVHQGWGDLIVAVPMMNYLSKIFKQLYMIIRNEARNMMEYLQSKVPNVVFVLCNKNGSEKEEIYKLMQKGVKFLPIGTWSDHIQSSFPFLRKVSIVNQNIIKFIPSAHYTHHFYFDNFLDLSIRSNYMVDCTPNVYNTKKNIILIHEDPARGMFIDKNKITTDGEIININDRSDIMFDMLKLMSEAKECHFINSSYLLLAYHYNSSYGNIDCPIYLHLYSRERSELNAFTLPTFDNLIYMK